MAMGTSFMQYFAIKESRWYVDVICFNGHSNAVYKALQLTPTSTFQEEDEEQNI